MKSVVAQYMETGSTVSSRFISKLPDFELSSASIRSVMLDLEEAGLLYAPHTSAGRMPTEAGVRLFVEGLLEHTGVLALENIIKKYPPAQSLPSANHTWRYRPTCI